MNKQQREALKQKVEADKRMKAEQATNGISPPIAPAAPDPSPENKPPSKHQPPTPSKPPKNPQPPQKVKPPVVRTEQVSALCQHLVPFEIFPDKQDKFRDARRKKLADKACPACRKEANAAREAKERAERAANPKKPKPNGRMNEGQRLPHGSSFAVKYDAERKMWSGTLDIGAKLMNPVQFHAECSGVFRLLSALDRDYRRSLHNQPAGEVNSP